MGFGGMDMPVEAAAYWSTYLVEDIVAKADKPLAFLGEAASPASQEEDKDMGCNEVGNLLRQT